jgi:hypothetical protein
LLSYISILFALPHIGLVTWSWTSFGIILYFSAIGFCLAYVRIKLGLKWSILCHYAYNGLLVLLSCFFGGGIQISTDVEKIKTDCLKGEIVTHGIFDYSFHKSKKFSENNQTLEFNYYNYGQLMQEVINCDYCVFDIQTQPSQKSFFLESCSQDISQAKNQLKYYLIENSIVYLDSVKTKFEVLKLIPSEMAELSNEIQPNYFGISNVEEILSNAFNKIVKIETDKSAIYFDIKKLLALKNMSETEAVVLLKQEYFINVEYADVVGYKYVVR